MSRDWNYKSGDWWILCDSCGRKIKASEARHRWDGFIVCQADFEMRHPQDYIRAKMDKISVPFIRPRPTDTFTNCTPWGRQAVADVGTADCATVGVTSPDFTMGL